LKKEINDIDIYKMGDFVIEKQNNKYLNYFDDNRNKFYE
jgi:hypothetical protein